MSTGKRREYSLYQIMVLCGDRSMKHSRKLGILLSKTETFISTWSTRGIPHKSWDIVSEISGVAIRDIASAQSHETKTPFAVEMDRYRETKKVDNVQI